MTIMRVIFLVVAALTLYAAFETVSTRRMIHAAFWLVATLFGVAVLFALLESAFFTVVQVMVYIGAIAILIIFVAMLTRHASEDTGPQVNKGWWLPMLISAAVYAVLVLATSTWSEFNAAPAALAEGANDIGAFGQALISPAGFLIPFEVASVLLLAALVGAIFIAVDRKGGQA